MHGVEHIMGMPIVVETDDDRKLDDVFDWFRWVDDTFSTYKPASEISRISLGALDVADAHPDVQRQLLSLLRTLGPDILLATHSTEILAEADPSEIALVDKAKYKQYIGRLVVDQVVRGDGKRGYDLKVYRCRPKLLCS